MWDNIKTNKCHVDEQNRTNALVRRFAILRAKIDENSKKPGQALGQNRTSRKPRKSGTFCAVGQLGQARTRAFCPADILPDKTRSSSIRGPVCPSVLQRGTSSHNKGRPAPSILDKQGITPTKTTQRKRHTHGIRRPPQAGSLRPSAAIPGHAR
jgi:hypothetical protein